MMKILKIVTSRGHKHDFYILTFESVFIQPDYHYQFQSVEVQKNLELIKKSLSLLKQITVFMHTQEPFYFIYFPRITRHRHMKILFGPNVF